MKVFIKRELTVFRSRLKLFMNLKLVERNFSLGGFDVKQLLPLEVSNSQKMWYLLTVYVSLSHETFI